MPAEHADAATPASPSSAAGAEPRPATGVESGPSPRIEPAQPGESIVTRALISVSDKSGVVELGKGLVALGVEIVSTGGTARELSAAGVPVTAIEDFTGFPEMMDGRVKTLHPRLYAGLLARRENESHLQAAALHEIQQVDLVCVNLYPFQQTIEKPDATVELAIENIDIGGPTMIRAAAKNHDYAAVLVDPGDYETVLAELTEGEGKLSLPTRRRLASKAFALTARYDAAIADWFAKTLATPHGSPPGAAPSAATTSPAATASSADASQDPLPDRIDQAFHKQLDLRYGENPHQRGAYYAREGSSHHLFANVKQLHGKELSFNNLLDLAAARELAYDFDRPCCVIVKHNNPCGVALADSAAHAYTKAFACDPLSAFGGVIALNRPVDLACAEAISKQFVEVLIAPGFDRDALQVLTQKKNVRLLDLEMSGGGVDAQSQGGAQPALEAKPVLGGLLLQDADAVTEGREQIAAMTSRQPTEDEWDDLLFAWQVCMRVRSNAIVIAKAGATVGIGAGQMSRVDAVKIAVEKAREFQPDLLASSALASDAYFPFPDGPQAGIDAGVTAIVQPGGSVKDADVVAAADAAGIAMVATGVRHFRH